MYTIFSCETSSTDHTIILRFGTDGILLVQALRPDRLVAALRRLAACELGVPGLAPNPLNLDQIAEEASPATPTLFVVSAGGDPSAELRAHAAKCDISLFKCIVSQKMIKHTRVSSVLFCPEHPVMRPPLLQARKTCMSSQASLLHPRHRPCRFHKVSALGPTSYFTGPVVCRVKGQAGFTELALGQGQNQAATEALQAAACAGRWLCIKNTHLAVTWLPEFHRKLVEVASSAAPGFRLWMTSEPHELFPTGLLSACLVRDGIFLDIQELVLCILLCNTVAG